MIFDSNATSMFWNMLGSSTFWTALSAIATTGACIIALWQTQYNNRKKIKLKFSITTDLITSKNYISISVINTGNRKIVITEWCYFTNDKSRRVVISTLSSTFNPVQLPQTIDIENKLDLYFDFSLFVKYLEELIKNDIIKENQKITFGIKDSTDKIYKTKSQNTVKEFLNSNKH